MCYGTHLFDFIYGKASFEKETMSATFLAVTTLPLVLADSTTAARLTTTTYYTVLAYLTAVALFAQVAPSTVFTNLTAMGHTPCRRSPLPHACLLIG